MNENAKNYYNRMFPGKSPELEKTDPEFVERMVNFTFDEVVNEPNAYLEDKTRFMVVLATLIGCQAIDEYKVMARAALNFDVTPVEMKEIAYQACDYCGVARVFPFLNATNEVLKEAGFELPLPSQCTTTPENRLEKGAQCQTDLFKADYSHFYEAGPKEKQHINKWLSANCFGDYYTRTGLNGAEREMITFCLLSAQGGCEPQLIAHSKANMKNGNTREFLIRVVSQALPYIGYPRSLNALSCIEKACETMK